MIVISNVIMINDQIRSFALMGDKIRIQYHTGYTSDEHYPDNEAANKVYNLMKESAKHAGLHYVYVGP